ncbi:MAG TPA: hypothetical protein VL147_16505 [Devosia sp.]|nr:hypothetical protein [Devosia sp.]
MSTPTKTLTAETAALHEALYLRLATLARQTETGANKRPDAPVSKRQGHPMFRAQRR